MYLELDLPRAALASAAYLAAVAAAASVVPGRSATALAVGAFPAIVCCVLEVAAQPPSTVVVSGFSAHVDFCVHVAAKVVLGAGSETHVAGGECVSVNDFLFLNKGNGRDLIKADAEFLVSFVALDQTNDYFKLSDTSLAFESGVFIT
ncbi:hypothetical protein PVAG01_09376 [Phlyctema vagabunda]|uniref:Uncharacterized protein n=1 Tax=Phlyctema vagabunda TaxID=108571 RepID=A0ABR4P764_9HELO